MSWLTPAATGLLLTCLYVSPFMNRSTSARWMAASVMVPLLLVLAERRRADPLAAILGGLFLAWAFGSMPWALSLPDALNRNWHLLTGLGAFLWGAWAARGQMTAFAVAAGIGMAANSVLVLIDLSGIAPALVGSPGAIVPFFVRVTHPPAGTFMNGNYMAESAVVVLAMLAAAPLRIPARLALMAGTLPAALLGGSRGAVVALVALAGLWGLRQGRWRSVALMASLGAILAAVYVWRYVDDPYALVPRLAMWANALAGWTWTGYGSGSFLTGYALIRDAWVASPPSVFGFVIRPQTAHNDLLTILFEYGVAGTVLALAFVWRVAAVGWRRPEAYVFAAVLALGLTNFPLYNPLPLVAFCVACGCMCSGLRSLPPGCGTRQPARPASILSTRASRPSPRVTRPPRS